VNAKVKAPEFAPGVKGEGGWTGDPPAYRVTVDGGQYTTAEARKLGFVTAVSSGATSEYVQANGFQVRGIIRRGDAQKFDAEELREHVRQWLVERGVRFEHPDMLEAFTFNYHPGIDLDEARLLASKDMTA
jgi:hypothetical protein